MKRELVGAFLGLEEARVLRVSFVCSVGFEAELLLSIFESRAVRFAVRGTC